MNGSFGSDYSIPTLGDLDGDGDLDLIVGVYDGTFRYYLNTGTVLAPVFTQQTGAADPLNGVDLGNGSAPTLGDLDGDGDLDLIAGEYQGGFRYFLNIGTALAPSFAQQIGIANPLNGVDLGDYATPTLGDIDGDGDLDLIAGEINGTFKFYLNTGTALVPLFAEQTGTSNPFNGLIAGFFSSPTLGDLDGDGDLDLMAGEDEGTFNYYLNTTIPVDDLGFTQQTGPANPLYGIDIGILSSPTLGDLDSDGDLDLIAGEIEGVFKYYLNTGTALFPIYVAQTGTANPLNGVDLGYDSTPALGDLDGDGDLDLIAGEEDGTFNYYLNTGTALAPTFSEQTGSANPLNGVDVGSYSTLTLGDLDGDGDLDLIAGETYGTFKYYLNTGTALAPVFSEQTGTANPLNGVDVGDFSTPTLGDLDGDGDLDLIAGEYNGTFKYYQNTGTALVPVFSELTGISNPLNQGAVALLSTPTLGDLNGDGDLDLVTGEFDGYFTYFISNSTPTDISLSNNSVAENSSTGTAVGNFSTTDLDSGDTFTYTLVSGTGSTDNASFTIVGNQLRSNASFDFETKTTYSVRVRTTDSVGATFEKVFTINVTDVNDSPTDISLSNNTIAENSSTGTAIGDFSTTDPDTGDTFTYTLVSGTGSTDNASFTIVGNQLRSNGVFDFETKNSYSIRVRTTDSVGATFEKIFTINVTDVNETPTDISLSNNSVAENSSSGTAIGNFSTTDPDTGDTFTYTLVSGTGSTDNASFTIVGNQLRSNGVFDFETKNTYSIRLRTTDQDGEIFDKVFSIGIADVNEAPVLASGFFPQLPDWWRKSDTNDGDSVANIINSVTPNTLITDQDTGALKGFAVIDATNLNGTWECSTDDGTTWNSLADTSTTNARLLNEAAKLRFVPFKKKFSGDVTLTVVAWDQSTGTNGTTADATTRGLSTPFSTNTTQIKQTILKKRLLN